MVECEWGHFHFISFLYFQSVVCEGQNYCSCVQLIRQKFDARTPLFEWGSLSLYPWARCLWSIGFHSRTSLINLCGLTLCHMTSSLMVSSRIILYFLLSTTTNSDVNLFQKCLQTAREMEVAALLPHVGLWVAQDQIRTSAGCTCAMFGHLTPAVSMGTQAGYKMCHLCAKVECDSFHVHPRSVFLDLLSQPRFVTLGVQKSSISDSHGGSACARPWAYGECFSCPWRWSSLESCGKGVQTTL